MAAVIEPAYQVAMDGCIASEDAINEADKLGFKTAYDSRVALDKVHATCEKTRGTFETIRGFYNEAKAAYEVGLIERAEVAYRELVKTWASLKGGGK
jgi:hypothetical protein